MRKSRALKYGIPAVELHKPELHNTQCSIVYAAQLLAISRQHLYRLIKEYGVSIIKTKGCGTICYKDIISILEKLDTNSDCTFVRFPLLHITLHCFRHTFAMQLLETGADIYTIATLLGHKSVSSTQVYARVSQEEIKKAVLRLV